MSEFNEDQRALKELSRIAHLYILRGELERAAQVLALVEDIQNSLRRQKDIRISEETGQVS
ncbi:MAG: hypothetical protein ACREJM_14305 [Candidatus Saccharimonadales bacterium]